MAPKRQTRQQDLESRLKRVIRAANGRIADQVRGVLRSAVIEHENRQLRAEVKRLRQITALVPGYLRAHANNLDARYGAGRGDDVRQCLADYIEALAGD